MDYLKALREEYNAVALARIIKESVYKVRDEALDEIMESADQKLVERYESAVADVTKVNKLVKEQEAALKEELAKCLDGSPDWTEEEIPYGKLIKHIQLNIIDLRRTVNWLFAIGADNIIEIAWDNAKVRGMLEALLGDHDAKVVKYEEEPAATIVRGFKVQLSSKWEDYEPIPKDEDTSATDVDPTEDPES